MAVKHHVEYMWSVKSDNQTWLFTMSQPGTNMHQLIGFVLTGMRVGQEKSQLKLCTSCEVANMSHYELLAGTYVQTWNTLVLSGNKECKPPLSLAISALVSQKENTTKLQFLWDPSIPEADISWIPHPLFHISIDFSSFSLRFSKDCSFYHNATQLGCSTSRCACCRSSTACQPLVAWPQWSHGMPWSPRTGTVGYNSYN